MCVCVCVYVCDDDKETVTVHLKHVFYENIYRLQLTHNHNEIINTSTFYNIDNKNVEYKKYTTIIIKFTLI